MSSPDPFTPKSRKVVLYLLHFFLIICVLVWSFRLGYEPLRVTYSSYLGINPTPQERYYYESTVRTARMLNRRFYLSMANTAIEVPLNMVMAFVIVRFDLGLLALRTLLGWFVVETAYWVAAFGVGMWAGSFPNAIIGGILMGFSVVWVVYLAVMVRKAGKMKGVMLEDEGDDAAPEGRRGSDEVER
ncbi:Hypothetical protein D9617_1g084710 [Elsinoe fawcettii]|nr:Hypothetical protein D9617_1g084710 [Elsinoe fawcettii]